MTNMCFPHTSALTDALQPVAKVSVPGSTRSPARILHVLRKPALAGDANGAAKSRLPPARVMGGAPGPQGFRVRIR